MPRASKAKYTAAQKRQAAHIESSYEAKNKSEAAKARTRSDSSKRAAASRKGYPRNSQDSLQTQSKASLLQEARAQHIVGRYRMRKQELIEALRQAA